MNGKSNTASRMRKKKIKLGKKLTVIPRGEGRGHNNDRSLAARELKLQKRDELALADAKPLTVEEARIKRLQEEHEAREQMRRVKEGYDQHERELRIRAFQKRKEQPA